MPSVPYSPVPGVAPSTSAPGAPGSYFTQKATPDDFGAQVGQAAGKLGQTVGQASSYLDQHELAVQGMNNERDALNVNIQTNQQIADKWNGFAALNGKDAADAYPQFVNDIAEIHQAGIAQLQSPEAQLMADKAGQETLTRFTMAASRQAAEEQRRSWGTANVSAAASASDQAVIARNDPDAFATQLTVGRRNLENAAGPNGWDDQTLKLKQQQFTDSTYSKTISAIATTDPMEANSFYLSHKDQIGGDAQADIEVRLKPLVYSNQSRAVVDNAIGGKGTVAASAITNEAFRQGQDPKRALTWARLESGIGTLPDKPGNPHTGLFQMGPDEWKASGGQPSERGDTAAEARVGVASMAKSMAAADQAVGGKAQDWQGYLVQEQGVAGGPALLKADPATNVVDALAPAYRGNKQAAAQAISDNGGNPQATVGDFLGMIQSRYAKAEASVTVPSGVPQSTDIRDNAASLLQQARNIPDPFGGDDPAWHDMVEARMRSRIGEIEYGQAQAERAGQQTLMAAAIGAPAIPGSDSSKPTDLAVLMQDPKFATAWSAAKPETQRGIMQILEHNARHDDPPATQPALQKYNDLRGEAVNDPAAFQRENLTDPDLVKLMPQHLVLDLINRQQSSEAHDAAAKAKGVNYQHAVDVMRRDLTEAGIVIPTKPGEKADVFTNFTGQFDQALDKFLAANKRPPNDSEIKSIGQGLLTQGYQTGSGFLGMRDTPTRLFQSPDGGKGFYIEPPAADRQAIVTDWAKVHPGQTPTDQQIRMVYTQSKLRTAKPAQTQ